MGESLRITEPDAPQDTEFLALTDTNITKL